MWEVRNVEANEAEFISQLAFRSKGFWGYDATFMRACEDELRYSAEQVISPAYIFRAAVNGSSLLGFYALETPCVNAGVANLEALFIEPSEIGKGLGKGLFEDARRKARELKAKALHVQSDPNAEKFYIAMGGKFLSKKESGSIPGRYLPLLSFALE